MTTFDFLNPETYKANVAKLTTNIVDLQITETLLDVTACRNWLRDHNEFSTTHPEQAEVIQTLLIDNEWIGLQMMPHDTVLQLFSKYLLSLFTMPDRYDFDNYTTLIRDTLNDNLRYHLLRINLFDERDDLKKKLVDALVNNQEQITSAAYFGEIKSTAPTTANWFKEYTTFMVPGTKFSHFQQSKFFKTNENVLRLNDKEKDRLQILFDTYERIRLSSWDQAGLEETFFYDGEQGIGVIEYGEIIPYSKEATAEIRTIMEQIQAKQSSLNTTSGVVARPPVDHVQARPTVHPDIKGLDIDATKGPDHFAEQDVADIEKHQAKSTLLTKSDVDYVTQAEDVKHQLQIVFHTPEVEKKFTDLLISVLRGLRDVMELRGYLKELHYSDQQIETIVSGVKQVLVGQPAVQSSAQQRSEAEAMLKPTFTQVQNQMTKSPEVEEGVPSVQPESQAPAQPTGLRRVLLPKLRRARRQKKPMIDDVKLQQSMVMGPLDELRSMDLIEFRRLSPNPTEAATKLKDKIELLGEEAVSKQAEGIQAFKQSPVNRQYLDIGNTSIATGKPVVRIIQEMSARGGSASGGQAAGTPVLSVEEFNAVADLNKQIRF